MRRDSSDRFETDFSGGFAYCAHGWMSDYKGYWYHTTAPGCGTGTGFRDGSSAGNVGAYCCRVVAPILPREYVGSSFFSKGLMQPRLGAMSILPEMQPELSANLLAIKGFAPKQRSKAGTLKLLDVLRCWLRQAFPSVPTGGWKTTRDFGSTRPCQGVEAVMAFAVGRTGLSLGPTAATMARPSTEPTCAAQFCAGAVCKPSVQILKHSPGLP